MAGLTSVLSLFLDPRCLPHRHFREGDYPPFTEMTEGANFLCRWPDTNPSLRRIPMYV